MRSESGILDENASMQEAILGVDWSATPIGDPSGWPLALTSIVSLILASGKPMFIVWGPHRTLLYNDAYIALLGAKHPLALGKPFFSVWPDAAVDLSPVFDRLFGNAAVELDDISISFDREEEPSGAHFAASFTPIRGQGHGVVGALCIHSDATRATSTNRLGPRDQQLLAKFFEEAPSLIAVLSGLNHRFELANTAFLQLVGDRPIIGKPFAEALPEAAAQGYVALLDQVFERGEPVIRSGARYAREPAPGSPNLVRFVDFVLQPITDATGAITGIFMHGSDVSERIEGEMALRRRETHLSAENADLGRLVTERSAALQAKEALIQAVYEYSSECHIVVREVYAGAFRVEEINPAALQLCRATREQVIGRTIEELLLPTPTETVNSQLTACLAANGPYHCELVYDGFIIEGTASPLPVVHGSGPQIAISGRNVTERRNLEEQLRQSQKMEAVGQLTGGLAHDFNNLLTGIMGALDILERRLATDQPVNAGRYITIAKEAAQRAAALTQRLLAFARRQALDARSIDVNRLVGELHHLIDRTMGPMIRIEYDLSPELFNAWVDPNQLENALLNLCINARDAMPNGGALTIETRNRSFSDTEAAEHELPAGNYLSLRVRDTGIGMPPGVLAKVFEPFFTTKPVGEGTGLGLSMVYGFARQSGGQVRIESAVDRGTNVQILLPRHAGASMDMARPIEVALPPRTTRGETILVVDDESMIRLWVRETLNDLGYATIEADNGLEGLKLINSTRPIDLLITDIGLPGGIDGRQLAAAASAIRRGLPILFMTGYGEDVEGQFTPATPGEPLLRKPFAMHDLAVRVSRMMQGRAAAP